MAQKLTLWQKIKSTRPKTKLILITAITITIGIISFASVFAYQVYLENTQDNTDMPPGQSDCRYGTKSDGNCIIRIDKPVIYLYPTKVETVTVRLDYSGKLVSTYPDYDISNGWRVIAKPDGNLTNLVDDREYSYLFWEGNSQADFSNFDTGFVIKGSDTKEFLQSKLSYLGLTPKEYNEMIVYWLPKMEHNNYNLIRFAGKEYTDSAKLSISPEPDSILRVFMVYKPLDKPVVIKPQKLQTFERNGFSVIEWGGTEIK